MHWYFSLLCGSGFGKCVWMCAGTVSRGLTEMNVTKYRCAHTCLIILHRRPPAAVYRVQCIVKSMIIAWLSHHSVVACNLHTLCASDPSTVWQLPPTTFWWPVTSPHPRSSSLVFYEPGRGSPWSYPIRSPVRGEKFRLRNSAIIF